MKLFVYVMLISRSVLPEPPSPSKAAIEKEFAVLQLKQLKRLATLGVGGFGRVELVCFSKLLRFHVSMNLF